MYKFTQLEKQFFKYASMLVKRVNRKEHKQDKKTMNEAFKFMKKMLKAPATPRTKPKQYTHTINEIDTTVKASLYK